MRNAIEEGRQPGEGEKEVVVSTTPAAEPKPPPGQIYVELPYESSLSVTGRKVIRMEIKNTHITKERAEELNAPQDTQSFLMEQELQARIQGTVARKTTINVNFDDTKENVRDFSVIYKGDPDEVVQEAAFGDITLSIPPTEFVNYNKQLFGIRTALKYKNAGLMFIGSRTKGTTETRRFTGATERKQVFVNDTEYVRRKYYDLRFPNSPTISNGTSINGHLILPLSDATLEDVYIEDTTGLLQDATTYAIAVPTVTATTLTLRMRRMSRGVDYSIDRLRGIITFNNPVNENVRVAIDFALNDGTRLKDIVAGGAGAAVLIKDKTPEAPDISQDIKRFYSAKARNITRDNGLGNFTLKTRDKNRETEIELASQKYPDTIDMNFETGVFELDFPLPYDDIYVANVSIASPLHIVFVLEYQAIKKIFTLRPNIVLQSERVEVNGRKVTRDLDYFIDYDIGTITFFNEDLIRESTVIEITYEFAPFGGQLGETLVGTRGTYDVLTQKKLGFLGFDTLSLGSSAIYNFSAKPLGPPDIRSAPSSLLVVEGDTHLKGLKANKIPITTNIALEAARSVENPNLFGRALVDSMEGIKQEDTVPLLKDSWLVAANPVTGGANTIGNFQARDNPSSALRWDDISVGTSDPNDGDTTQKALVVDYDLNTGTSTVMEQVSIVNTISLAGRDFSKKTTLEVEVEGAGAGGQNVDLLVDYGTFNEDADGDNLLDTEDTIPFDGILNLGEDTGIVFNGPGPDLNLNTTSDNVNAVSGRGNGRMDTEDLDGDRVLNTQDFSATLGPIFQLSQGVQDVNPSNPPTTDLNYSGRRLFSIPLNIDKMSDEAKARMQSVKQVRVTLRNTAPGTSRSGRIFLTRVSIVGNTWEPATLTGAIGSTMTVKAVNSKDDAGFYTSLIGNPLYNDLYKGATPKSDMREQALALDYELLPGSTGTTKNAYATVRDLSKYDTFIFFLSRPSQFTCSGSTSCGRFFFQAGSETEYQQLSIDVSNISVAPEWTAVIVEQRDENSDGSPETWVPASPNVDVFYQGSARSLSTISQFKIGIANESAVTQQNQIWVNEIHVKDPHDKIGHAKRYTFDTTWTGWMDVGGTFREVDRNFQTPTTAINNRDDQQSSGYLNFNRLSFLPMTFRGSRNFTKTPSAFRTSQNALVSFREEGTTEQRTFAHTAKFIVPKLPPVDFSYDTSEMKANLTQRRDIQNNWRVGTSYSPPIKPDLLPGKLLTFQPLPESITALYSRRTSKVRYNGLDKLIDFSISTAPFTSTNLTQFSDEGEARMAFRPWSGFTFNPMVRLKVDREKREFRQDELDAASQLREIHNKMTPRSMTQTITASGNFRLLKWLDPRYNYSLTGTETNDPPTLGNTTAYYLKTITRSGSSDVSAGIQAAQIFPRFKLLQSMTINPSYRLEKGDTYQSMPKDAKWRDQLWISKPLDVSTGTAARRTDATERRTTQINWTWIPFSAYKMASPRFKPLNTLSLTNNYQFTKEDRETTGTNTHIESRTWPDQIFVLSDTEDFFNIKKVIDNSRLTYRTTTRKTETRNISRNRTESHGIDYLFQFWKKLDFSTNYNINHSRDDNLITHTLSSKSTTKSYGIQTGIPLGVWRFTPRYDYSKTKAKDSIRDTNDLKAETYSLQIYGDITKPLGLRVGRAEFGIANRFIVNSNLKWDKKRSAINPSSNYLDVYSATMSGDYTISNNFRIACGGNFSLEKHHPDFKKMNTTSFGINSTLTIQF